MEINNCGIYTSQILNNGLVGFLSHGHLSFFTHSTSKDRSYNKSISIIKQINNSSEATCIDSSIIFLTEQILLLDSLPEHKGKKERIEDLTAIYFKLSGLDNVKRRIQQLSKSRIITHLSVALELTNQQELSNSLKLKPHKAYQEELLDNAILFLTNSHNTETIKWIFSNDYFKINELKNRELIIKNYILNNKKSNNINPLFFKNLYWLKIGVENELINPSIQELKTLFSTLISGYFAKPAFTTNTQQQFNNPEINLFLEIFVSTKIFKNNILIYKNLNEATNKFFSSCLTQLPQQTQKSIKQLISDSEILKHGHLTHKLQKYLSSDHNNDIIKPSGKKKKI